MILDAYKTYSAAGLACLPTGPDKMPSIPKGQSWKDGWNVSKDYSKAHGLAIIAGFLSGNLECIDFDNHFGDAKDVLSQFAKIEGVKDIVYRHKLPIQSTVSGGFHLLYRCDQIEGNQKLASRPRFDNNTQKTRADVLIETRGEGGYFVATPTPGYKIVNHDICTIAYITSQERAILLSACRSFNQHVKIVAKPEEDRDKPGDRFNRSDEAEGEMISALKKAGWVELKEGLWRRPGKDKGISATLGRAAPGIFYNFSSSADPFESEKGYTAFQVVGLLDYNGDFKTLAADLRNRFGDAPVKQEYKKKEPVVRSVEQLDNILQKAFINMDIPIAKPPVVFQIRSGIGMNQVFSRVFTLGNFSAITGKSKSKKTFLTSLVLATVTKTGMFQNIFFSDPPPSKRGVILFDTEQSPYDAYMTAKRVYDLCGASYENFGAFDLREYSPLERCEIIERALMKMGPITSLMVIDGIADLATAINDEIEASRVVALLMRWTKQYNVHICTVIHQNKDNNYATGHLGSAILKKSECIISVTKDTVESNKSEVVCDMIRGTMDFDKFSFFINEAGLPIVEEKSVPVKSPFLKDNF